MSPLVALPAVIPSPTQSAWYLGPLPIRPYALCILMGILVAVQLSERLSIIFHVLDDICRENEIKARICKPDAADVALLNRPQSFHVAVAGGLSAGIEPHDRAEAEVAQEPKI